MRSRNDANINIRATDKTGAAFKSARSNMLGLGKAGAEVNRALQVVGVGAGLGLAAGSALAAKSLLKGAAEFETAVKEVNSLLNLDEVGFEKLTDDIQRASLVMGVDLIDTTKAAYQAISAGVPKENLFDFLTTASTAAIAGVSDTETAVDVLTTVINSWGAENIDAARASDILFSAVKDGKTNFNELASAMSAAAPLAAQMGLDFEEVAAAAAAITSKGATTSEALTQVRAIIVAMKKPTAELTNIFNVLNVENGDALVKSKGFSEALRLITSTAAQSDIGLAKVFSRVEGLNGVLSLTGKNAAKFSDSLTNAYDSAGAAAAAFAINNDTAARASEKLHTAWQNLGANIQRTSNWRKAVALLTEQVNGLNEAIARGNAEDTSIFAVDYDIEKMKKKIAGVNKFLQEEHAARRKMLDEMENEPGVSGFMARLVNPGALAMSESTIARIEEESDTLEMQLEALLNKRSDLMAASGDSGAVEEAQALTEAFEEAEGSMSGASAGFVTSAQAASDLASVLSTLDSMATAGTLSVVEYSDQVSDMMDAQNTFALETMNANEMMLHAAKSASDGMTDAFMSFISDGKDGLGDLLAAFMETIAAMAFQQAVATPLVNGILGGLGGAFGGAASSASVNHAGGMAGAGVKRSVSPAVFASAPRYHSGGIAGLKPGEVPSILQRGEEVLTANDPRHVGNGGGSLVPITFTVNAIDSQSFSSALAKHQKQIVGAVDQALNKRGRRGVSS